MTLDIQVSEVEGHFLSCWQPDQIDTLAIVGVTVRPVRRNDNSLTFSEGTTTTRVTCDTEHTTVYVIYG